MNNVALLKGFRDYLPEDAVPLFELKKKVQTIFESFGFEPFETPALEYAEILMGKYGAEGDKLMYRFVDHGDRQVALRYDHTVPLARAMTLNQDLPLPFKRYVIGPVWRADKPQKGRLREFYQCDVDIVGSSQARADAEIIALCYRLLSGLGIEKFGLQINNRKILDALAIEIGLAKTQVGGVFHAIDKFPKYGEAQFIKDTAKLGLSPKQTESLLGLITTTGSPAQVLNKIDASFINNKAGSSAVQELRAIADHALALGVPEKYLNIDLKIVRGLDYYTGMVVESILEDLPLFGSVFGGGRYDNLMGMFSGKSTPAVGVSLGLGRLFDALKELKMLPEKKSVTDVLVAIFDAKENQVAEQLADKLRKQGLNTEVYLGPIGKLEKQLRYADRRNIPWVVWQGPEEKKKKVFAAKELATRKQVALSATKLIAKLKKATDAKSA